MAGGRGAGGPGPRSEVPGELPIVLLPVAVDDDVLDACLAALDAGTPAGTRIWLADDAQAGPRGLAIIEHWLQRTPLRAEYTRRQRRLGEVAHLDEALAACGDADVIVLAADATPGPGWAARLAACAAGDGAIATATPWCNAGETAGWPACGEVSPQPDGTGLARLARAAADMPMTSPELPSAIDHAVFIRGRARAKAGGLDAASYASWYAALIDLSLRMAGLGWRNVLCETAFVARGGEGGPAGGDLDALAARWPGWHPRLAEFLMHDPISDRRRALAHRLDTLEPPAQHELFTP
ncbi:glycosyltransferase [Luteimonas sp. MJ246]|uniref:glycosyltransferase family 2 protein n=1 Tax=Luteimonas sp. MJ174 TaxID=3129237 RepID=UPI0031BB197B